VPIPGLGVNAFEIVEDGRTSFPPQTVATQVNPDAVVSIALVVDLSGSMAGKPLEEAKAASIELLDALLNVDADPDRVAFFGINRDVAPDDTAFDAAVEVPFGNDKNMVLNVVNFLAVAGDRPTPLYDALFRVVKFTAGQSGNRAIIVISDGVDTVSTLRADDPINEANRNNIPIFPISLGASRVDEDFMQRLAVRTGGQYRKAPTPEEFTPLFQQVLDQMKLQYKLGYQSRIQEDDNPHSLLVRVRAPQAQGFDEVKFTFDQPAPAPAGASGAAPQPTAPVLGAALEGSAGAATVAEDEGDLVDDITTFVEDNPLPAALIGAAALLLLLLIVLLIVWARRRRAAPAPVADFGADDWQVGPAAGVPATEVDMGGQPARPAVDATATAAPTVGPGYASPGSAPAPWPGAPAPASPSAAPAAGATRIIQRAPQHAALLIDRKDASRRYDLLATTDIGRAQGNTVVINDPTMSRQHARVRLEEDRFLLFDLGSANGTFVNGAQVEAPVALADGDTVRFGEAEFTFKQLT
jgi:Mg-chelatase subunit ChlD